MKSSDASPNSFTRYSVPREGGKKCVDCEKEFAEDNINCMKDIPMTYVSFIINEITGSEKKEQEELLSY